MVAGHTYTYTHTSMFTNGSDGFKNEQYDSCCLYFVILVDPRAFVQISSFVLSYCLTQSCKKKLIFILFVHLIISTLKQIS